MLYVTIYKKKLLVEWAEKKILIIHDIVNIKHFSYQLFKKDLTPDIVIYGHTHRPKVEKFNNILYLNPGSVSKPRSGKYGTVMILTINDNKIEHKCIEIK